MTLIEQEILKIVQAERGDRLNRIADEFREGRDVHEIIALLDSQDAELASIGAWILGELRLDLYNCEPFISRLRRLVEHGDATVRFHAIGALFPALNWEDASARHLLAKLRCDSSEGVRRIAEAAAVRVPSN